MIIQMAFTTVVTNLIGLVKKTNKKYTKSVKNKLFTSNTELKRLLKGF